MSGTSQEVPVRETEVISTSAFRVKEGRRSRPVLGRKSNGKLETNSKKREGPSAQQLDVEFSTLIQMTFER